MASFGYTLDACITNFQPPLSDVVGVLQKNLTDYFMHVGVEMTRCPDLSLAPFNMTAAGFGGKLRIAEVGGPGNLFPSLQKEKIFDIGSVCSICELPAGHAFGPGAGPWPEIGTNCEMVADVNLAQKLYRTRIAKLDKVDPTSYSVFEHASPSFSLMANLAVSEGRPGGQVGIFIFHKGLAKLHIMPDFPSSGCFQSEEEISKEWLKYFSMKAPLICTTVMHTADPTENKLRLEHTHCYSDHGEGGHYHYDTTPEEAEYEGWFALAESVYRIDQV